MTSTLHPLWKDFSYFPHQLNGIQWMLDKEINGTEVPCRKGTDTVLVRGGLQCDDMGLGKTLQSIAIVWTALKHSSAGHDKPLAQKAVVVAPSSLVGNWT